MEKQIRLELLQTESRKKVVASETKKPAGGNIVIQISKNK